MPRSDSVSELAASLGGDVIVALHLEPDAAAGPVAVLDPQDGGGTPAGAVVLAVGVAPEAAGPVVTQAAADGAGAVVVKLRGTDPGPLREAAAAAGVSLLAAADSLPWHQLVALLGTARGGDERALGGVGLGDLFGLSNAVAAATGGATAVEDPGRKILAYSTIPGQPIDDTRQQGILGRQVPDLAENDDVYRRLYRAQGVMRLAANSDRGLGRMAVAVRSGAELLGSLWVVDAGDLLPDAEEALLQAARLAALHLLRARSGADLERQARGESLRLLLEGRAAANLVAERLGVAVGAPCRLVGFALPGGGDELLLERLHDLVALRALAVASGSSTAVAGDAVWALLPGVGAEEIASLVEGIVSRSGAALGAAPLVAIGEEDEPIGVVHAARRELEHVLAVIRRTGGRTVASRRDVQAQLALLDLEQTVRANPRLHLAALSAMLEHDRAQGGAYAGTLLAYLDCLGDVPSAADRVAVHPNTFRYRLRRAAELFGVDLDNPDERLVLWLQLRALT